MSRTTRGSKAPGYEYWSRRPGNRHGGVVGPDQKRFTKSAERQQSRAVARDEVAATWLPGDATPPADGWDEFEQYEAEQIDQLYAGHFEQSASHRDGTIHVLNLLWCKS